MLELPKSVTAYSRLCNVSSSLSIRLDNSRISSHIFTCYPPAASQNTPLFFGPLQPEMTPKFGSTLPTTNTSHPSTGASCSENWTRSSSASTYQWPTVKSYFLRIMEVKPSPIMPPAETQPSVQISVEHPNLATSIQYGISSYLRRPLLIIQYSSLSQHRLPPQKYKPTSDKPKVPFFMDKVNTSDVSRTEVVTIPRENPRDWVCPAAKGMHEGDKVGDKPKLEPEEMHYDNCGDDKDVACHFAT